MMIVLVNENIYFQKYLIDNTSDKIGGPDRADPKLKKGLIWEFG